MPELPPVNPFSGSVLTDARLAPEGDVPSIQAEAFAACQRVVEQARLSQQSASLLLNGVPGSGKTHLLARLRVTLEQDLLGPALMAPFVYVRLDSHPSRLWRHLRKPLVEDLNRPIGDCSCLDRILAFYSQKCVGKSDQLPATSGAPDVPLAEALAETLDSIVHDSSLARVLTHLALKRHRLDALGWLRGDSMPEAALQRLGIQADEDDSPEDLARTIVIALIKILQPAPVVICFDQIEALEVEDDKHQGYAAFGRLGATLHDRAPNLALISCIQTSQLSDLLDSVSVPDQGRLFKTRTEIKPLNSEQGEALVKQRLALVPELMALRKVQPAPLWPLDRVAVTALLAQPDCTPRRLITACSELYERARGLTPRKDTPRTYLEQLWEAHFAESLQSGTREDADGILHAILSEVVRLTDSAWRQAKPAVKDIDLSLKWDQRRIQVSLCNHNNMRSLVARLKRLNAATATGAVPAQELVILRHPKLTISRHAHRTRAELAALIDQGARFLQPSEEAMAALAALRKVLAEAQSGDLHASGEGISPAAARAWISAHFPAELLEFVHRLLGVDGPATPASEVLLLQNLLAYLEETFLASVEDIAQALAVSGTEIIDCARSASEQVRVIEGDPVVIYRHAHEAGDRVESLP